MESTVESQRSFVKPIYFPTNYRNEIKKQLSDSRRSFAVGILGENLKINTPLPIQTSSVTQIPTPSKYFYSTPSHTLFKDKSSFKNLQNLPTSSGLSTSTDEVLTHFRMGVFVTSTAIRYSLPNCYLFCVCCLSVFCRCWLLVTL